MNVVHGKELREAIIIKYAFQHTEYMCVNLGHFVLLEYVSNLSPPPPPLGLDAPWPLP